MAAPVSGIVTPEAVVLEFETAGMASRLLSGFIDLLAQGALLFGVGIALSFVATVLELGGLGNALFYLTVFLVIFGYPVSQETLWRGRTLGKAALGLRVVTVEGAPIRFRHAAIRAILGLLDKYLLTGAVGIVSLLVTTRNQRLGDLVAGTIVLRERSGAGRPTAVTFPVPYGFEDYVASLDVSRLSHDDYAAVRSFLLRAAGIDPASRYALASRLASSLLGRLHTTPPSGAHPELFLACVASAYQRRSVRPGAPAFASVWGDLGPAGESARGAVRWGPYGGGAPPAAAGGAAAPGGHGSAAVAGGFAAPG
ncbi:MAG TPA: RDD family protein [Acidimicrobiales bacterium]|nr:RDD family protein [Acidimicrobiales bacterium]